MINRIRNEPALVSGLIVVLLNLGAAFGLDLTGEQTAAITAASAAILAFVVRSQVTPTRKGAVKMQPRNYLVTKDVDGVWRMKLDDGNQS